MSKDRLGDGPHTHPIIRRHSLLTRIIDAVRAELHRSNTKATLLCGNLCFAADRRRSRLRAHGRSNGRVSASAARFSWCGERARCRWPWHHGFVLGQQRGDCCLEEARRTSNGPVCWTAQLVRRLSGPCCFGRTRRWQMTELRLSRSR